jgi:hypothetical protein
MGTANPLTSSNAVLVEEREPALQARLAELVGLGMLSQHQADVLHTWLTGPGAGGGAGVEPPPITFEDGRFGSTLYDTLRAAIVVRLGSAEVDDGGPFDDIIDALLQAAGGVEELVTTIGDFLDRLFG